MRAAVCCSMAFVKVGHSECRERERAREKRKKKTQSHMVWVRLSCPDGFGCDL